MNHLSRLIVPAELAVPFIPLGIDISAGLEILSSTGAIVIEKREKEHFFRIELPVGAVAIYTRGQHVDSVWYDDPIGRWSDRGKKKKIELHLARYGAFPEWSVWNESGWMTYWKHSTAPVRMVYGIHMDVLRFNHLA